ncbi:hypothetical protein NPIL_327901 [Nephila pilipes]|uniref:Spider venom protein n=1 Tax=Nephila pilipes TaxID=299642 RepID=A0A8X6UKS0_NEPPI|nr:hypothetical protein NPIL_327901 [Nephila pilipes]
MKVLIALVVFGVVLGLSDAKKPRKDDSTPAPTPDAVACDPMPCKPPCKLDFDAKPCPKCKCKDATTPDIMTSTATPDDAGCPQTSCAPGCQLNNDKPCPKCDCGGNRPMGNNGAPCNIRCPPPCKILRGSSALQSCSCVCRQPPPPTA